MIQRREEWVLRYFKTIRFERNHLVFENTGAVIRYDRLFLWQIWKFTSYNLYLLAVRAARAITFRPSPGRMVFHPQTAGPWYNAWMVAHQAGFKITKSLPDADYVFVFDDYTHSNVADSLTADQRSKSINLNCTDISKNNVGRIFKEVFGYSIDVDPTTYTGPAVEKSDENGTHDGRIVDCPIRPDKIKPGMAYQKLVDSCFNGKTTEDLRIAVAFGDIPVVFHKYKDPDERFGTHYLQVDLKTPEDVFSKDEIESIVLFCERIGLDYGAVDVLRDQQDERIYIVDANKTCMPVLTLSLFEQIKSKKRVAASFRKGVLGQLSG